MIPFHLLQRCFALSLLLATVSQASAQTNYYGTNGTEYALTGTAPGNHIYPDLAISSTNGFLVWQDNVTDGSGWGISACHLDSTYSAASTFRVNRIGTNNQEHARVAMLHNGGAVFVWQGGAHGFQHIYAEFLTPTNTFVTTNDILIDSFTNYFQIAPTVAVLTNGNVVILWSSYDQAGTNSMQDIYGQIMTPTGTFVGTNFLVNQFTSYNQRTPAVAALSNGGFVATWISEQEVTAVGSYGSNTVYSSAGSVATPSVSAYARLFSPAGAALGSEFKVETDSNPCADPAVAGAADGSYLIVWGEYNQADSTNGWDIYARSFTNSTGGSVAVVNTRLYGDQYGPRISNIGLDYLVTWTSLGQDGSREGVYGQFLHNNGAAVGTEFRVNTTTAGSQMQAAPASDGVAQFLVLWSGVNYTNTPVNFDLYAQRYANAAAVLNPMSAPFVWAPFTLSNNIYQPRLTVTWPSVLGLSVSNYQVFLDGSATPAGIVTSNQWTMTAANGLTTNATHFFAVNYVVTGGRSAPLSATNSGTTWSGLNWGGIPYEWMAEYFGGYVNGKYTTRYWPAASTVLAPGFTLTQVFVSGGSPLDSTTWLQGNLIQTSQGLFLSWNTQAGATYQVQNTVNFQSWSNVGSPRFAAGASDSIYIGGSSAGFYRVVLLRQ